jgi:hypothetical protein
MLGFFEMKRKTVTALTAAVTANFAALSVHFLSFENIQSTRTRAHSRARHSGSPLFRSRRPLSAADHFDAPCSP